MRALRRRPPRPATPLRSSEEQDVRDAVLAHLLRVAAYAEALPEHMLADNPPTPDPVLFPAAIARPMQAAIIKAGQAEIERITTPARLTKATDVIVATGFDTTDPRALQWAQEHAADLVTNINAQQQQAIRNVLATSFSDQVTGPDTAARLRTIVGLSTRYATAVDNAHAQNLARNLKAGMPEPEARAAAYRAAQAYRDRLIRSRANTIARTEIMTAQNTARQLAWTQQVEDGYLSKYSRKKWVAHDTVPGAPKKTNRKRLSNPCRICAELHGQTRRWDEPWPKGYQAPPAHPNCRCVQVILPPALPGDDDYLADLSSDSIDRAVDEARSAVADMRQGLRTGDTNGWTDLEQVTGARPRKALWEEESTVGGTYRSGYGVAVKGDIVPTQKAIDTATMVQRAGAKIRRRAEARVRTTDPEAYQAVQDARRAVKRAEADVATAIREGDPDAFDAAMKRHIATRLALPRAEATYSQRVATEVSRTIAERRPMGQPLNYTGAGPTWVQGSRSIDGVIPDDWKVSTWDTVKTEAGGRASLSAYTGQMYIPDGATAETLAHELVHAIEFQRPTLKALQWAWLGGRISKNKGLWNGVRTKQLRSVMRGYASYEKYAYDANLRNPYGAKVYGPWGPTRHSEVFALAMQHLLYGTAFDDDALDLLIGSLAVVP